MTDSLMQRHLLTWKDAKKAEYILENAAILYSEKELEVLNSAAKSYRAEIGLAMASATDLREAQKTGEAEAEEEITERLDKLDDSDPIKQRYKIEMERRNLASSPNLRDQALSALDKFQDPLSLFRADILARRNPENEAALVGHAR